MKKMLLVLLFACSLARAAPWLTGDSVPNLASNGNCTMFMDAVPGVTAPVALATAPAVGNVPLFDMAFVAVGSHSVQVLCTNPSDPLWGGGGAGPRSVPLAFVRPASSVVPGAPPGLRLVP